MGASLRGMPRRWAAGAVVAAVLGSGLAAVAGVPASAHGSIDRGADHAECSTAEFPGSKLITTGESRQSFKPTRGGVASVELCIQNLVGILGTDFTVTLYDGGTASAPGPALAAVPFDAGTDILAAKWVHVDFPVEVPTTPGATYVIGVAPAGGVLSSVTFQWRASCNDGLLTSCAGVPDAYPDGNTNDLPGNADYGFRTFPLHDADLVGALEVDPAVCPGLDLAGRAIGTVTNDSETSVGAFDTEWLWSTDAVRDETDTVIAPAHNVPGLAAGAAYDVPPPTLPTDLAAGEGHLLLHIDTGEAILERDDLNNLVAASTTVIGCGQPEITELELAVDEDEIPAGVNQLQYDDLDRRALASLPQSPAEVIAGPAFSANGFSANGFSANGFSANGFSANGFSANGFSANGFSANGFSANGFSANGFSANGFSANGFSPASGIDLADILADLPAGFAERILVVDVPIAGPGWVERLAPFTDEPIQNITLARASELLADLDIGDMDLTKVFNMSWLALALARGALDDIPLPNGMSWCTFLASYGFDCATVGVDPATTSLLGLEATGFPTHQAPIADLAVADIVVDPDLLVLDLPLAGQPRFNLEHTRIGQVAVDVAVTDPDTIADCQAFDCSRPLAAAAAEGALLDVTVRELVGALSPIGREAMLVGDLAMGTASLNSLRLSSANWNVANAYQMDPECPAMTYRLTGRSDGEGAAVDPTASVTLAPGFVYVPDSVALTIGGAPAPAQADPTETVAPDGTRTYAFALDGALAGAFELSFSACASVYLGHHDVGQARIDGEAIDGPYSATTDPTTSDTVKVVERTPGPTTQPLAFDDNVVVADHISAANDHDLWTFPVKPEPGTMYVVKLFNPIGVDLDLIGYGPAVSANGFSANGFSANGFSANGFSANGFSANGFSANGFSANGFSTTAGSDLADDVPIAELAPPDSRGHLVSAHRGDDTETLYAFSTFGDEGTLAFAVVDYAGTRTDAPYFLTLQTVRPTRNPVFDTCDAAPWDLTQAPGAAPAPWSGTQPPRTLFVTNRQVAASTHGAAATDAGMAALAQLAARPEVRGIVVAADHDPDVRAAYANWRNDWCNPTAANAAATHVRSLILELRAQYPSIDTVVLAGGDEVVPDFRLNDGSLLANELQYAEALVKATGGNNALVAAYANGTLPSADPYGNEAPLPFGMTLAFPPSAGVSRLVETPADWVAQKDQYVAANGQLDPADGLVTGYDGMVDGAEAAAAVLRGAGVATTTLTDSASSWTAADFRNRAFGASPDIAGWNAHANHWAILSDAGSDNDDPTEVVTSDEVAAIPFGGFVFSNGCHFGTSVPDVLNGDPTEAESVRLLDWNQAIAQRRGIAVTNSGFGIFDTEEVGQGERLQALFVERLQTAPNAALALAQAKNEFLATVGVHDAYSFKTLQQLSMYGLGIFAMAGSGQAPPPPPAPAGDHLDVTAGPYTVAQAGSTCTDCYLLEQTDSGVAVDLRDADARTGHTATSGYWSAPLSTTKVTLPPGKLSAGLWFNDIDSVTLDDVDPVLTRLAVNRPDRETETQSAAPFPTTLGTVHDVAGQAVVTLLHGINQPTRMANGRVMSDVHLYTRIDADVLLRPAGTVGCTPHVDEVTVVRSSETSNLVVIDVLASEACGPNQRAAVLARDDTGAWTYRELGRNANGHWSGAIALAAGATELEDVHVQVSNGRGVGHWRNKGDRPLVRVGAVDGVDLLLSGNRHPSGVFLGPVQATIDGQPGVVYSVYDNDRHVGDLTDGQTFTVAGDGSHEIVIEGSDGSSYAGSVAIDSSPPTIVWQSPADGAVYAVGEHAVLAVACPDAGTGATCVIKVDGVVVANGAPLPTSKAGTHVVTVTATDGVGRTTTASRSYTVKANYVISPFFSPIKPKPQVNAVNKGSTITIKFTVTNGAGFEYTDPAIIAARLWQPINCTSKQPSGTAFNATGTTPTYSSNFHFNVNAPTTRGCFEFVLVLDDGTRAGAYFQTK